MADYCDGSVRLDCQIELFEDVASPCRITENDILELNSTVSYV